MAGEKKIPEENKAKTTKYNQNPKESVIKEREMRRNRIYQTK